ncbi:MAG: hypothetical protein ACYDBQ_10685 [Thermoplasmatota archaeon]
MARPLLWVAAFVMAGCTAPATPPASHIGPGFYLVGGTGSFTVAGVGNFTLYDGHDVAEAQRVTASTPLVVDIPGAPVLQVPREEALTVSRAGVPAPLSPLGPAIERVLVAGADPLALVDGPLVVAQDVNLTGTPNRLAVLATGAFRGLDVLVSGNAPLLHASGDYPTTLQPNFTEVPATQWPERIVDGHVHVHAQAASFQGDLILESYSFSRRVAPQMAAHDATGSPPFGYGSVPDGPEAFQFAGGRLWMVANATATVALYDPHDHRIGTYALAARPETLEGLAPGSYVAIASGPVALGADRAPRDAAFHALARQSITFGGRSGVAGYFQRSGRTYGVAYQLSVNETALLGIPGPGCTPDGIVEVREDHDVVGVMRGAEAPAGTWENATLRLNGDPVEVWWDGFDDSCFHPSLEVDEYQR